MTTLTPDRLWRIPRVGAPVALDDGRLIVPVTTYDEETDARETTLWRVDLGSEERRPFARGEVSSPAASDDGRHLAYLRKVGDHRQVHVQPLDGGEGRPVGELPLGAVGVRWTPDHRLLALAVLWRDHPDLEATRGHEPDARLTARTTEAAVYRYWDAWLDHVYHPVIIDPEDGSVTDLTPGALRFWTWPATGNPIEDIDVSPDGNLIAFSADDSSPPHRELSWSLFLMNADGSDLRRIDTDEPGHSRRPRFTPDGAALVYGYQAEPDFYACRTQLVRLDLATGERSLLAAGWDRSAEGWTFDPAGDLLFTAEDEGRSRLWRLTGDADSPRPLTERGWVTAPVVSPDGAVSVLADSLTSPAEVYRVGDSGLDSDRATAFTCDSLNGIRPGEVRELTIPGAREKPIQVWLVDPPDADPRAPLPLVHMIHGGPHGVFGDTWHWRWNSQVVAAAGYRVALVNFHGSTGWGDEFVRSIHGAWGDLPFHDIEAASDHLIETGMADPERIAVTGGSYGGYLTAWITSQTDRYRAAIAHAAVTNLMGMYASDITRGLARAYGSEAWEDRAAVERWSPSSEAPGYETPTLVIHGATDGRVPATQGLELYGVLVAKGVPARLVHYPNENHWILSRTNSIHWYGEFLGWLERWL
jgi:dipeptidyl aminopeptidase/acylaminoacyl peptidase